MNLPVVERLLNRKHVYIVDDNADVRRGIHAALSAAGFTPRAFISGADFVDAAKDLEPGCVLLDLRMPDIDGLGVLKATREILPRFHVIMISAHGDVNTAVKAMRLGAIDFMEKPFTEAMLIKALHDAFASLSESATTVEMHRARMMDYLGAQALPDAIRIAFDAELAPLADHSAV